MELYHEALRENGGASGRAAAWAMERVAGEVCKALEKVCALPALLPREIGPAVYDWLAMMPGVEDAASARKALRGLYAEKTARGLFHQDRRHR
jgi:hypothetical protein